MNKADLIDALSERLGSRHDATLAVEGLVDIVIREVTAGGSVGITGFGTFERTDRAPRTGRNPRTGESVPIAGTSSPRFRPGTYFKRVVADPSGLPAEGLAGGRAPAGGAGASSTAPARPRRAAKAGAAQSTAAKTSKSKPSAATSLVAAEDVAIIESELKDSAKKTLKKAQESGGKKAKKKDGKAKDGKGKGGKKSKKK